MTAFTFFVVLGCAAIIAEPAAGQQAFQTASLNSHNKYRAMHQNTPGMTLDADLNNRAQLCANYYANKGTIDHTCDQKNGAGENLYMSWGGTADSTAAANGAAKLFYDEIKDYDYNNPGFSSKTGHFTQLVWVKSTKLGAGYAKNGDKQYIVNLYREHGNYQGQFPANVLRPK